MLLQIQPSVVVVSSRIDDNMHRTLHSYGISGEQSEWGVVTFMISHCLLQPTQRSLLMQGLWQQLKCFQALISVSNISSQCQIVQTVTTLLHGSEANELLIMYYIGTNVPVPVS